MRRALRHTAASFLVLIIALLSAPHAFAAGLQWSAGLDGGAVTVRISTREIPQNQVVVDASFKVTFIAANGRKLGDSLIEVLDRQLPTLVAGLVYELRFTHTHTEATRIAVGNLAYTTCAAGCKNDGGGTYQESAAASSITGAGTIVPPPPAVPLTPQARCDAYARAAVAQNVINLARSCGLAGSKWSADASYHASWCMGASPGELEQEAIARNDSLRQCSRRWMLSQRVR